MRKISVLLAMGLLLGLLPGCDTGYQPSDITIPENTTTETTTPEETTTTPTITTPTTPKEEPKAFHLEIGDAVVVTQGAVGDNKWGHYQFPGLAYTLDGNIVANWSYSGDTTLARLEKKSPPTEALPGAMTRLFVMFLISFKCQTASILRASAVPMHTFPRGKTPMSLP